MAAGESQLNAPGRKEVPPSARSKARDLVLLGPQYYKSQLLGSRPKFFAANPPEWAPE